MGNTHYRIFGSPKNKNKKRIGRGRKKKNRRADFASARDGGQRKRAGRLSPAVRSSKAELREQLRRGGQWSEQLRRGGQWRGQVHIYSDFNELPDDFMKHFTN